MHMFSVAPLLGMGRSLPRKREKYIYLAGTVDVLIKRCPHFSGSFCTHIYVAGTIDIDGDLLVAYVQYTILFTAHVFSCEAASLSCTICGINCHGLFITCSCVGHSRS